MLCWAEQVWHLNVVPGERGSWQRSLTPAEPTCAGWAASGWFFCLLVCFQVPWSSVFIRYAGLPPQIGQLVHGSEYFCPRDRKHIASKAGEAKKLFAGYASEDLFLGKAPGLLLLIWTTLKYTWRAWPPFLVHSGCQEETQKGWRAVSSQAPAEVPAHRRGAQSACWNHCRRPHSPLVSPCRYWKPRSQQLLLQFCHKPSLRHESKPQQVSHSMICAELCYQMPFAAMVKPHETLALQQRVWVVADLQSPFVFLTVRGSTAKISPSHFTRGYFRFQDTPSVRAATGLSPKQQVQLQPCLCKEINSTPPETQRCSELSVPQFPLPSRQKDVVPDCDLCNLF